MTQSHIFSSANYKGKNKNFHIKNATIKCIVNYYVLQNEQKWGSPLTQLTQDFYVTSDSLVKYEFDAYFKGSMDNEGLSGLNRPIARSRIGGAFCEKADFICEQTICKAQARIYKGRGGEHVPPFTTKITEETSQVLEVSRSDPVLTASPYH